LVVKDIIVFLIYYMERKIIRKIIYKTETRRKFFMKSIKRKVDFIKAIIHIVRCSLYLKAKACGISLEMHKVWKLYAMSSVMWTCWNDLGLNLCVVSPMSYIVTTSEDSLERRKVKYIVINTRDLVSTLVNYQASYYKVITSLKYIK